MLDYQEIQKIRKLYDKEQNIMKYLRSQTNHKMNTPEMIAYSYDLQAGNYLEKFKNKSFNETRKKIGEKISKVISELGVKTILEAGVGEADTLHHLISSGLLKKTKFFGFDISLSRLLYAQKHLKIHHKKNTKLFCSEFSNIPLDDNSIDLSYTFQAIEPNHGREEIILKELLRITKHYLVLIEPSYELGTNETRKHIEEHGYCRDMPQIIKKLGFKILKHELFRIYHRMNNETAIIVVEKNKKRNTKRSLTETQFVSPLSHKPFLQQKNYLYCKDDGYAWPIINGIPCLLKENAILASKLTNFLK